MLDFDTLWASLPGSFKDGCRREEVEAGFRVFYLQEEEHCTPLQLPFIWQGVGLVTGRPAQMMLRLSSMFGAAPGAEQWPLRLLCLAVAVLVHWWAARPLLLQAGPKEYLQLQQVASEHFRLELPPHAQRVCLFPGK
jgi:hypothetical protein